jgi:hypothetical protein
MYRKTVTQIADTIMPMQKRLSNDESSQIKQVAERARPMAVPNEQIKQKSNFESSAKLRFITSDITLLRDEIYPDMEASSITVSSISRRHIYTGFGLINRIQTCQGRHNSDLIMF